MLLVQGRRLMKALEDLSLQYDNSVRNSENTIVQLSYGDDGLNPERMENNGRPIDYQRLHMNIRESSPCSLSAALSKIQANQCLEKLIEAASNEGKLPQGNVFLREMRDWLSDTYNSKAGSPLITAEHLKNILAVAADRFTRAHVEPGEAIGATAAQSISEPATQMTLKVS
jgi:DNA-directed RNA polymerase III subunit RPC1